MVLDESAFLLPTEFEGKIGEIDDITYIIPNEIRADYRLKFLIPPEHDSASAKELFMNSDFDAFLYIQPDQIGTLTGLKITLSS